MLPLTASEAVFHVLASRTEHLRAAEFRHVYFSFGGVLGILVRFEIIKDVQYLITSGRQRTLQRSNVVHVTYLFVLLTVVTEPIVTLVIFARRDPSKRRATSLSFAHGIFLFSDLLVFREIRVASKVPIAI